MTAPAQVRHTRGMLVVILLGIIFFTLIVGLVILTGRKNTARRPQAESLSVVPLRVRIRTEPNAQAAVVATATMGEKLTLLEDRDAWVRVQNDEGLNGWAERNNLERTAERERRAARYAAIRKLPVLDGIAHEKTPLYAGPGIFYPVIGEIADETQVKVYTRDHDFYAIDHNGEVAYVDVEAIDVSSAGTRQLEVRTENPPVTGTTASMEPPPFTDVPPTQAPPIEPPPPVETPTVTAPAPAPQTGIYSAVPLGGTQPEEVDRVVPRYPAVARRAGVQGAVVVRGVVRRDGVIDDVVVIKDLPFGLGDAAREAVSRWKFRPATYRGEPIDVYYTVTVNFRLSQ